MAVFGEYLGTEASSPPSADASCHLEDKREEEPLMTNDGAIRNASTPVV